MKKADTIISHILNLPKFKFLPNYYCYRKFVSLLKPQWKRAIAFVYIRENTLFVALWHPGFKNELNYNQDLLKSILSLLKREDEKCNHLNSVNKVIIFNSKHNSILKKEKTTDTVPYYSELALAEFHIASNDKELIEKFNTIKENIIKNI
ncbi:MAG TPA: hypothetical protein ENK76_05910 [Campylobacterales bacterium]|nr:hypothetical protein [Campylobacterales bacterium]